MINKKIPLIGVRGALGTLERLQNTCDRLHLQDCKYNICLSCNDIIRRYKLDKKNNE